MYLFSKETMGFYPSDMRGVYEEAGTLPSDVISVSDEVRDEFNRSHPDGLKLGVDKKGMPKWVELTPEEYRAKNEQKRASLRLVADGEISWRKGAVDEGIATESEVASLSEWNKYRAFLMRVDLSNPEWPETP